MLRATATFRAAPPVLVESFALRGRGRSVIALFENWRAGMQRHAPECTTLARSSQLRGLVETKTAKRSQLKSLRWMPGIPRHCKAGAGQLDGRERIHLLQRDPGALL